MQGFGPLFLRGGTVLAREGRFATARQRQPPALHFEKIHFLGFTDAWTIRYPPRLSSAAIALLNLKLSRHGRPTLDVCAVALQWVYPAGQPVQHDRASSLCGPSVFLRLLAIAPAWCCVFLFRLHPALPAIARERLPSDPGWDHEIKHDGFRMNGQNSPRHVATFSWGECMSRHRGRPALPVMPLSPFHGAFLVIRVLPLADRDILENGSRRALFVLHHLHDIKVLDRKVIVGDLDPTAGIRERPGP
jgi:hypothetical protein